MTDFAALSRLLEPLRRRVMLTVGRAVLRAVSDGPGLQTLQLTLLAGETRDGVERVQPYGLTTVPQAGAEAVVLCIGGNRDHPVAIVVGDAGGRPSGLGPGEVCLYSSQDAAGGHRVLMKADRTIVIQGLRVRIEATSLDVVGNIRASGSITPGAAL
jgi:phage baseplate assembly protein V